jgi:phosphatidylglycerol:prolipoprotein diacylglycerol transferase
LFHPVFLYEALWNLLGFGLLMWIGRRYANKLFDGDLFSLYLIWYSVGRILVEMLRPDAWTIGTIPTAQIVGVVLILIGVGLIILRRRRPELATSPITHPTPQPKRRRPARS